MPFHHFFALTVRGVNTHYFNVSICRFRSAFPRFFFLHQKHGIVGLDGDLHFLDILACGLLGGVHH